MRAFLGLAVGLKAVAEPVQQLADDAARDAMAEPAEFGRKLAQALGGPLQRRRRIVNGPRNLPTLGLVKIPQFGGSW